MVPELHWYFTRYLQIIRNTKKGENSINHKQRNMHVQYNLVFNHVLFYNKCHKEIRTALRSLISLTDIA